MIIVHFNVDFLPGKREVAEDLGDAVLDREQGENFGKVDPGPGWDDGANVAGQGGGVDEALGEEGLVVGGFDLGGSDQAVDAGGRL